MNPQKPTRQQREAQLRNLFRSAQGRQEVCRIVLACFPPAVLPAIGVLMIETILLHEYGPGPKPLGT